MMNPSQALGSPALIAGVVAATVTYTLAVVWMTYSTYHITPELLQVQLFRKLDILRRSVLFMGLGLACGLVLMSVLVANVDLPDVVWGIGAAGAALLFWYGLVGYSRVFHVPRTQVKEP